MDKLRVIDASVMPIVTSGNTNAPVIMIAEKGSDLIKARWLNGHIQDQNGLFRDTRSSDGPKRWEQQEQSGARFSKWFVPW